MRTKMIMTVLAASLVAPAAHAEERRVGVLDAVAMSGSQSLAIYALSNPALPRQMHETRDNIASRMGLSGQPGDIGSRWMRFSPVLTYDGNINGGSTGDSILAGGFRFEVGEEFRAVSGILVGGSVNAGMRVNLAERTALELDLGAMAAWAPQHDMTKNSVRASACVRHMLPDNATHLRGCVDGSYLSYELGETRKAGIEAGVSRAFASTSAFHEVSATGRIERSFGLGGDDQLIMSGQYIGAFGNGWTIAAGAAIGSKTEERISMRERVSFAAATIIADRPTQFSVSVQNNRGGMFLGESRQERIVTLGVNRPLNDKLTARVNVSRTVARHDFFNDTSVGVDFGFRF